LYDRRGNVIWWDDCELGLGKWVTYNTGLGSDVTWDNSTARMGRYSIKLTAGTQVNGAARIWRDVAFATTSRVGFEFAFQTVSTARYVTIVMRLYGTGGLLQADVRLDLIAHKIQVWTPAMSWQDAGDIPSGVGLANSFNVVKVVLDFTEQRYARGIFNNLEVPLDFDIPLTAPLIDIVNIRAGVQIDGTGVSNEAIYADDFIITINEP